MEIELQLKNKWVAWLVHPNGYAESSRHESRAGAERMVKEVERMGGSGFVTSQSVGV
jgi:hypothetical protein